MDAEAEKYGQGIADEEENLAVDGEEARAGKDGKAFTGGFDALDGTTEKRVGSPSEASARKLFVGGISWKMTPELGKSVVFMLSVGTGKVDLAIGMDMDCKIHRCLKPRMPRFDNVHESMPYSEPKIHHTGSHLATSGHFLKTFTKHFAKYGEISDSVIMKDKHTKKPRGFGFVTFVDPSVVEKVLKDDHVIDERTVEVKRTVPRGETAAVPESQTRKIFVGGIPTSVTDDELNEYFSAFGNVVEHQIMTNQSGHSRGFGFVTFESGETVEGILSRSEPHEIKGKQVEIKKAEPKRSNEGQGFSKQNSPGSSGFGSGSRYGGFGGHDAYRSRGGSRYGPGFGYGGGAGGYGGAMSGAYGYGPYGAYDGYGGRMDGYAGCIDGYGSGSNPYGGRMGSSGSSGGGRGGGYGFGMSGYGGSMGAYGSDGDYGGGMSGYGSMGSYGSGGGYGGGMNGYGGKGYNGGGYGSSANTRYHPYGR